ncbi:MAG: hypothetical protein HOO95_08450 [Gallionella sp.]|nr:hypothetical protein [Gallionella sp.]
MKNIQKVSITLAGAFASVGLACILGFLLSHNAQDHYLLGAVIFTSISVVMLLVSVFFISPSSVFLFHRTQYRVVTVSPKNSIDRNLQK